MNTTAKPNFLKAAATYGLYIGLFLILCHLLEFAMGAKMALLVQLVKLVGSIGLLVYGMKRYRDMNCEGFITYGNAFGYGILTSLFSTILYVAYIFVTIAANPIKLQEQLYLAYEEFIEQGLISVDMVDYLSKERLGIMLTTLCTLKCKGCYLMIPDQKPWNADIETIKASLPRIFEIFDYFDQICLMGGEPFLYKDLVEVLV